MPDIIEAITSSFNNKHHTSLSLNLGIALVFTTLQYYCEGCNRIHFDIDESIGELRGEFWQWQGGWDL